MRHLARLIALTIGALALAAAVAVAATSPSVSGQHAIGQTDTTVTLQATINPNGAQTGYTFAYGPTTSYGYTTPPRQAGHGTKPVIVRVKVTGLIPGTPYHFHVIALSPSGTTVGVDRVFSTTGHMPPAVVTGPAVGVGKYAATVTGSIDPEGAPTTWVVQYGLTAGYTMQTIAGPPLAAVTSSLPVTVALPGLAPGVLFHYRIVATHADVVSDGLDQTFFTYPSFRRTPRMTTRTTPLVATHRPYQFTTSGALRGALFVPAALRCTGTVSIRYFDGGRRVARAVATVGPDCRFSTPVPFNRLIGGRPAALTVAIHYRGNGYLKPVDRTDHVTLG